MVTTGGAWIWFYGVEGTVGPVDGIVIVAEDCAGYLNRRERDSYSGWEKYVVCTSAA